MQVTKGTWRMFEQCVPGSPPPPPHESLGTRLLIRAIQTDLQKAPLWVHKVLDKAGDILQSKWLLKTHLALNPQLANLACETSHNNQF